MLFQLLQTLKPNIKPYCSKMTVWLFRSKHIIFYTIYLKKAHNSIDNDCVFKGFQYN